MRLSEAISLIEAEYPVGCRDFYAQIPNDPWEMAAKELESKIGQPEEVLDLAVDKYAAEIIRLERNFKLMHPTGWPKASRLVDVFLSGSTKLAEDHNAKVTSVCAGCFCKAGLVPYRTPRGDMIPMCKPCRATRQREDYPALL